MAGMNKLVPPAVLTFLLWCGGSDAFTRPSPDDALDAAFQKALDYLAQHQRGNGSWDTSDATEKKFYVPGSKRMDHFRCMDTQLFVASLAGLSFLGEGSTFQKGKYAQNLSKAFDFVSKGINDGDFGKSNHGSFSIPYVVIFFAELLAVPDRLTDDQKATVRKALEKTARAVQSGQKIEKSMGAANGAWGYGLLEGVTPGQGQNARRKQPAASVSLTALLIAKDAGIDVPQANLDQGTEYLLNTAVPSRGDFAYQTKDQAPNTYGGYNRTASALYVLLRMGKSDSQSYKDGVAWLEKNNPKKDQEGHSGTFVPWAYFFGTLFMNQMDAGKKDAYFDKILKEMIGNQAGDGSWSRAPGFGPGSYKTAMRALALAIPRGQLAVFKPR